MATYVKDGKDDIGPPSDILNRRWSNLDNDVVAYPVGGCRDTGAFLSQPQRQDL